MSGKPLRDSDTYYIFSFIQRRDWLLSHSYHKTWAIKTRPYIRELVRVLIIEWIFIRTAICHVLTTKLDMIFNNINVYWIFQFHIFTYLGVVMTKYNNKLVF